MEMSGQFYISAFSSVNWIGGCGKGRGRREGLEPMEKNLLPLLEIEPQFPNSLARSSVAVPTELSHPQYSLMLPLNRFHDKSADDKSAHDNSPCARLSRALLWECGFVCAEFSCALLSCALLSCALLSGHPLNHIRYLTSNYCILFVSLALPYRKGRSAATL
jgi:hypothetical protein